MWGSQLEFITWRYCISLFEIVNIKVYFTLDFIYLKLSIISDMKQHGFKTTFGGNKYKIIIRPSCNACELLLTNGLKRYYYTVVKVNGTPK